MTSLQPVSGCLGFLKIRQEKLELVIKENVAEFLTELLQDTCDSSWESAKATHCVLLHQIHDGMVSLDNLK